MAEILAVPGGLRRRLFQKARRRIWRRCASGVASSLWAGFSSAPESGFARHSGAVGIELLRIILRCGAFLPYGLIPRKPFSNATVWRILLRELALIVAVLAIFGSTLCLAIVGSPAAAIGG
jgi:hypothetical protein